MANYMVRVELFGASPEDYERLHARMDALGIERELTFSDGSKRQMPSGTYFGPSSFDVASVRDRIKVFANPLSPQKDAAIFVCQVKDDEWSAFLYPA
ncbi:hypothetical protein [Pseudomonas rustica]|uniref:hypothetical protein n=1 Tax=Pseudomonas rustica TaxID=2827099 RepID=UPI001BAFFB1E|nr:hypothetical protein [Pseudomonas rustica]MBS4088699.1 hypothetical protein [Pseudomonas rustica]